MFIPPPPTPRAIMRPITLYDTRYLKTHDHRPPSQRRATILRYSVCYCNLMMRPKTHSIEWAAFVPSSPPFSPLLCFRGFPRVVSGDPKKTQPVHSLFCILFAFVHLHEKHPFRSKRPPSPHQRLEEKKFDKIQVKRNPTRFLYPQYAKAPTTVCGLLSHTSDEKDTEVDQQHRGGERRRGNGRPKSPTKVY